MTPTEAPVLAPADESKVLPEPATQDKAWYYVFCNQSEKAVYVRKTKQCPATTFIKDCGCKMLFRLAGESTGDHLEPVNYRNIKTVPEVDDIITTCEGECIKVLSIEWL